MPMSKGKRPIHLGEDAYLCIFRVTERSRKPMGFYHFPP